MTLISCFERVNRLQTDCIVTAARRVPAQFSICWAGKLEGQGGDSRVAGRH